MSESSAPIVDFLTRFATALGYAPLPARVIQLIETRLKSVTVAGRPVLPAAYAPGGGARR